MNGVRPPKALIFFGRLARQRRPCRLLTQHPAFGTVGPQHTVHGLHRRAETVVADEDFLLRALPLLDIDDQDIDAVDGAVGNVARNIPDFSGALGAIRSADDGIRNDLLTGKRPVEIGLARIEKCLADNLGNAAPDDVFTTSAEPFEITVIGKFIDVIAIDISDQNGQGVGEPAQFLAALLHSLNGFHLVGIFEHGAQYAINRATFIIDRRVKQVEDHLFRYAMSHKRHWLVAICQHFTAKTGFENAAVPVPDFRPDAGHRAAQRLRMVITGDLRITVIVDHHMIAASHQHLRNR